MTKLFMLVITALQGIGVVALFAIVKSLGEAFAPSYVFPFNIWWGLLMCLPGLGMAAFFHKEFR